MLIDDEVASDEGGIGADGAGDDVARPIHWRAAVAAISSMKAGDVITIEQFDAWFCETHGTDAWKFQWVPMRRALRRDHAIALSRVAGVGYEVSTDEQIVREHVARAEQDLRSDIKRMSEYVSIVNVENLSEQTRSRHEHAAISSGYFKSMLSQMNRSIARADETTRAKLLNSGMKRGKRREG